MRRLKKLILILVALQVVNTVLGMVLNSRFRNQQIDEDKINVVAVSTRTEEKVKLANFRGGYLRAVMGVVELDLTEAIIEDPPATIEMTVVMGGAGITVPEGWKVRVDAGSILGGVDEHGAPDEGEPPDLVLTGKVIMGGVLITHQKPDKVLEAV